MNRKVLLIGIAVMFVFLLGWMFLLYRPAGTDVEDARLELQQARDELSQLEIQLGRLRSIEEDLPRLQSGIETLRAAVPDEAGLADFILSINEAGLASGLSVASIVPNTPSIGRESGLNEVDVGISTEGGYFKVLDFLNRVASLHRIVTVESIGITAIRDADNPALEPTLRVTLLARIYMSPTGALAGAGGDDSSAETAEAPTGEAN